MPQVVEYSQFPRCAAPPPTLLARVRAWLAAPPKKLGLVRFENPSRHLLRDIGLGDDRPANRLLQDHHLRR